MSVDTKTETLQASITGADYQIKPSDKDHEILKQNVERYNSRKGPRVGDFITFSDGVVHRFSHDWGDGIQTSESGSFHFCNSGYMSFSGGLNPCVPNEWIYNSGQTRLGTAWFFHNGYMRANSAVYVEVVCRVFATNLPSDHWHKPL